MKSFSGRLKRLEGMIGVTEEKRYLIVIGFRDMENCLAQGRPYYRSKEGRCHEIKAVHEYHGEKFGRNMDLSMDETKAILRNLGYEEIKSKADLPVDVDNMTQEELIGYLTGRKPHNATNQSGG